MGAGVFCGRGLGYAGFRVSGRLVIPMAGLLDNRVLGGQIGGIGNFGKTNLVGTAILRIARHNTRSPGFPIGNMDDSSHCVIM